MLAATEEKADARIDKTAHTREGLTLGEANFIGGAALQRVA